MNALITGGAGFIGSHLTERMLAEGAAVTVLDDLSTGSEDNLAAVIGHPRFEFHEGTVLDARLVDALAVRCDTIVHLAAAVGVRYILHDPLGALHTNIRGTEVVLRAAEKFGARILVASTSEVYGKNEADSLCEHADSVLGPSSVSRWSYAASKKVDEFLALAYAAERRVQVIITRFFNIVGPRQRSRYGMVLPNFIRAALRGEPLQVFCDGRQTRNFTSIRDCVEALMGLLACPAAAGQALNIGGAEEISIWNLAERVRAVMGSRSPIVLVPYSDAYRGVEFEDMRRRVPCVCGIRRLTGWLPVTPLEQIIVESAAYERRRVESLARVAASTLAHGRAAPGPDARQ